MHFPVCILTKTLLWTELKKGGAAHELLPYPGYPVPQNILGYPRISCIHPIEMEIASQEYAINKVVDIELPTTPKAFMEYAINKVVDIGGRARWTSRWENDQTHAGFLKSDFFKFAKLLLRSSRTPPDVVRRCQELFPKAAVGMETPLKFAARNAYIDNQCTWHQLANDTMTWRSDSEPPGSHPGFKTLNYPNMCRFLLQSENTPPDVKAELSKLSSRVPSSPLKSQGQHKERAIEDVVLALTKQHADALRDLVLGLNTANNTAQSQLVAGCEDRSQRHIEELNAANNAAQYQLVAGCEGRSQRHVEDMNAANNAAQSQLVAGCEDRSHRHVEEMNAANNAAQSQLVAGCEDRSHRHVEVMNAANNAAVQAQLDASEARMNQRLQSTRSNCGNEASAAPEGGLLEALSVCRPLPFDQLRQLYEDLRQDHSDLQEHHSLAEARVTALELQMLLLTGTQIEMDNVLQIADVTSGEVVGPGLWSSTLAEVECSRPEKRRLKRSLIGFKMLLAACQKGQSKAEAHDLSTTLLMLSCPQHARIANEEEGVEDARASALDVVEPTKPNAPTSTVRYDRRAREALERGKNKGRGTQRAGC